MPVPIHSPNSRVVGVPEMAAVNPLEISWKDPKKFGLLGPVMKTPRSLPSIGPSLKMVPAKAGAHKATHRIVRNRVAIRSFKIQIFQ